jgi:hypothetical protein
VAPTMSEKYPRTYHFPFSPGAKNDDRIASDYSSLVGKPLVVTEKLDGENTCLSRLGVFSRSHAAPTRNPWATYLYPRWEALRSQLGDLELFGESLYAVHSIRYPALPAYLFLFAVRERGYWHSWEDVTAFAALCELPTVPVLWEGTLASEAEVRENMLEWVAGPSSFSGEGEESAPKEGVVVRIAAGFPDEAFSWSVYKWVRKGHVQTDQFWARNWERAPLLHEGPSREAPR